MQSMKLVSISIHFLYWHICLFKEINIKFCLDIQVKYRCPNWPLRPNSYCVTDWIWVADRVQPLYQHDSCSLNTLATPLEFIPLFAVAISFLPFCTPMCLSVRYIFSLCTYISTKLPAYLSVWLPTSRYKHTHTHTHRGYLKIGLPYIGGRFGR
jgi:hypothetical protein